MAEVKLSQIAASGSNLVAADTLVGVHGGTTDLLFSGTQILAYIESVPTVYSVATAGPTLKQGANGRCGTFICNGVTPVSVNNSSIAITDCIIISLNTVGGTVGEVPIIQTITATSGFTVIGSALDSSTYNYCIIKNAA
jgi:hypothetical protein